MAIVEGVAVVLAVAVAAVAAVVVVVAVVVGTAVMAGTVAMVDIPAVAISHIWRSKIGKGLRLDARSLFHCLQLLPRISRRHRNFVCSACPMKVKWTLD